jgi:hypothetical protein
MALPASHRCTPCPRRRHGWREAACVIALGLAPIAAPALEGLALYDDFSAPTLDPARWTRDVQWRAVENNALRLRWRSWGGTGSDSGAASLEGENAEIARGLPVTQMRANLRVSSFELTGCAANATPTSVFAGLAGLFFNTGNRATGSSVGDVAAALWAVRDSASGDPPGILRLQGRMFMCSDRNCDAMAPLGAAVDLGTVATGTSVLLQLEWDRANKRFLFSRDKGAAQPIAYTLDHSADAGRPVKALLAATTLAHCASGPRTLGSVDARFDNVAVNASAKP